MHSRSVVISALILAFSANATPTLEDLTAFKVAGDRLGVLIEQAEAGEKLQQLRTPEFYSLLSTIADGDRIIGSMPYQASELEKLMQICSVANKAAVSLMLFDVKARLNSALPSEEAASQIAQLALSNSITFQNELTHLQPFSLRCLAAAVKPLTEFAQSLSRDELTPIRRQGLARMRAGILQVYGGSLTASADARYPDRYRTTMLSTLAQTSLAFAPITRLEERSAISGAASVAAASSSQPYKAFYEQIVEAFGETQCDGLCLIE